MTRMNEPSGLRRAGPVAVALLWLALAAAAAIVARILIFEYFHGDASMATQLLGALP